MKKGQRNLLKLPGKGKECPRCGEKSEWRAHREITNKELSRPFYYERWYSCQNRDCKTTIFMDEEDRVYTKNVTRKMREQEERHRQISFFRRI